MELSEKKRVLSREEIQKRKRRRARVRAAALTVFILLVVFIICVILLKTVLFPISNISVEGNQTILTQDIIDDSGIELGDRLFSVSTARLNKILTVKQPYIKKVKIKYPSFEEIKIIITETKETFCYGVDSKFFVADIDNKILRESDTKPENLTLVKSKTKINAEIGYELNIEEFDTVINIYNLLSKKGVVLNELDVSNISFIKLKVNNRFIVNMGSISDIDGKLEHLSAMLPEIDAKNGNDITGEIDLSSWSNSKREGFFKPKNVE